MDFIINGYLQLQFTNTYMDERCWKSGKIEMDDEVGNIHKHLEIESDGEKEREPRMASLDGNDDLSWK